MITRDTLQDAYGRDWEPIYAPLNNFEDECAEQWHYQLGVSSLVDEDIAALIGKGSIYWMSSEDGQGACHERGIHGGVDSNGSTVYIGRSSYKGGLHPGEVTQSLDGIYIPWGGKRVFLQEYEKLSGVVSATRWIRIEGPMNSSSLYGLCPVPGGHESDMTPLYICQGFYEGGVHCSKIRENNTRALITCEDREISLSHYTVLVRNPQMFTFRNTIGQVKAYPRDWRSVKGGEEKSQTVFFGYQCPVPPRVIVGLNFLDVANNWHNIIRTNAYVDGITTTHFTAHIDAYSETRLFQGGISWMKLAPGDPDFLCGSFTCSGEVSKARVSFDWRFHSQPVVFVGLHGFEIQNNWRIAVSSPAIDPLGFDMRVERLGDTVLHGAKVCWVAFPGDKKGVVTGTFGANGAGTGHMQFPSRFRHTPKIFTALMSLEADHEWFLRIRIETSNVTTSGMDWRIGTWLNSRLLRVQVAYLALEAEE